MQIYFLIILGIYLLYASLYFVSNLWDVVTINELRWEIIKLEKYVSSGRMYILSKDEYKNRLLIYLYKYIGIRIAVVSILVWLILKYV